MQRVMKTSQQQTSQSGADEWTCSLAAFRASLSVMPGDEEARKMTAISGQQCIAPSMKSSPLGLWLKTLLESSRWSSRARFLKWQVKPLFSEMATHFTDTNCEKPLHLNESAQILKVTDMPSNRCLFRLVPSEPPTDETGFSSSQGELLPRPITGDSHNPNTPDGKANTRRREQGWTIQLNERARMGTLPMPQPFLKTPCTADSYTDKMKSKGVSGTSGTLAQEVVNGYAEKHRGLLLPTPLSVEREHPERVENLKAAGATRINSRVNGDQRPNGLIDFMQFYDLLPTPVSQGLKVCDENGKTQFIDLDLLPTPMANVVNGCDLNNLKLAERHKSNLEEEVAKMVTTNLLPTTIARDWKGGTTAKREDQDRQRTDQLDSLIKIMESQVTPAGQTSRLSPLFTEEMMGFPLMWTALPFLSASGEPKH